MLSIPHLDSGTLHGAIREQQVRSRNAVTTRLMVQSAEHSTPGGQPIPDFTVIDSLFDGVILRHVSIDSAGTTRCSAAWRIRWRRDCPGPPRPACARPRARRGDRRTDRAQRDGQLPAGGRPPGLAQRGTQRGVRRGLFRGRGAVAPCDRRHLVADSPVTWEHGVRAQ
jgi:hypothetical protein